MPEDTPARPEEPFDLEKLRQLIELMDKYDLSEISLRHGDERWRLRRGLPPVISGSAAPAPAPSSAEAAPSAPPPAEPAAPPAAATTLHEIKSPTVGTFYAAPSPDDPPFVTVGSHVEPDTIVCIVEAMKVFNQIPAECSGTITEILVNNGDAVEFGQPLFRVRPD